MRWKDKVLCLSDLLGTKELSKDWETSETRESGECEKGGSREWGIVGGEVSEEVGGEVCGKIGWEFLVEEMSVVESTWNTS